MSGFITGILVQIEQQYAEGNGSNVEWSASSEKDVQSYIRNAGRFVKSPLEYEVKRIYPHLYEICNELNGDTKFIGFAGDTSNTYYFPIEVFNINYNVNPGRFAESINSESISLGIYLTAGDNLRSPHFLPSACHEVSCHLNRKEVKEYPTKFINIFDSEEKIERYFKKDMEHILARINGLAENHENANALDRMDEQLSQIQLWSQHYIREVFKNYIPIVYRAKHNMSHPN